MEIKALYLALRDPRTPTLAKAVAGLFVGYALSPIDPIPDIIPILGYLDEVIMLPLGVAVVRRLIPGEVLAECRAKADASGANTRLRWVGIALTLLVWAAVGVVLWWLIR